MLFSLRSCITIMWLHNHIYAEPVSEENTRTAHVHWHTRQKAQQFSSHIITYIHPQPDTITGSNTFIVQYIVWCHHATTVFTKTVCSVTRLVTEPKRLPSCVVNSFSYVIFVVIKSKLHGRRMQPALHLHTQLQPVRAVSCTFWPQPIVVLVSIQTVNS